MTGLIDAIRSHVLALPDLAKFAVVVAAIVGIPPLAARIRLPAMVGLLLFGIALGPHVLGFFGEHRPIADFFAELGKLLLMFSAGLETMLERRFGCGHGNGGRRVSRICFTPGSIRSST